MSTPWFVANPRLLRQECDELARDYPEMKLDTTALVAGRVVFEGTIEIGIGAKMEAFVVSLEYPPGFPYVRPDVIPLVGPTTNNGTKSPRFFSARHQMANGSICLFEQDPASDPHAHVSGVSALRRARIWIPHALRGTLPPELDTLESELEGHYQRLGDVFIGPMMFQHLGRSGELILDFFKAPLRDDQYPLHMVTHIESGGVWSDDRVTLKRLGTDRSEDYWNSAPTAPARLGPPRVKWFSLEREPPPIRTSDELAKLLFPEDADPVGRFKREVAANLANRIALDVPVRFPARRAGDFAWLFFRFRLRERSLPLQRVPGIREPGLVLDFAGGTALDDAPPGILRIQDLRPAALTVRNSNRVPVKASTLKAALAGAGALGSSVADLLSKAGVGQLRIVDPALLDSHNAVRHLAGVTAAGMPKAGVVAAIVSAHNPHCEVSFEFTKGVLELSADDPFWRQDFIVSTIADDLVELALNRLAVERGMTVYYLRALRSGTVGRLVRVRPHVDACFECLGHYHAAGDSRAVVIPPQRDEIITRECGQPVLAASAADLGVVAGLGVRRILCDSTACGDNNQWAWTSEGIPEHPHLRDAFSSATVTLPPHPRCAVCAIGAPRRVRIAEELKSTMLSLARRHAPNETGGILVGRHTDDTVTVLAVSDAGRNAVSEPTRFERDGAHCQAFLERTVAELGPGVDYVGEWHSHPDGSPAPSSRDTQSFIEIAADPNYLTTAPVLLIVAPATSGQSVNWSASVFPVDGLARAITLGSDQLAPPIGADVDGVVPRQTDSIGDAVADPSAATR